MTSIHPLLVASVQSGQSAERDQIDWFARHTERELRAFGARFGSLGTSRLLAWRVARAALNGTP